MKFKRGIVALAVGAAVGTVGYASASVLQVDGGVIQYGESGVTCDADGVTANWGLETDDNTVRSVRISGIDADCVGADMFVRVGTTQLTKTLTGAESEGFSFTTFKTPQEIDGVKIWIEG